MTIDKDIANIDKGTSRTDIGVERGGLNPLEDPSLHLPRVQVLMMKRSLLLNWLLHILGRMHRDLGLDWRMTLGEGKDG